MTFSRLLGRLALVGASISLLAAAQLNAAPVDLLPGSRPGVKTNAPGRLPGGTARTNNAALRGATRAGTNASPAALPATNTTQRVVEQFRRWQASPKFYPAFIGAAICLALLFLVR